MKREWTTLDHFAEQNVATSPNADAVIKAKAERVWRREERLSVPKMFHLRCSPRAAPNHRGRRRGVSGAITGGAAELGNRRDGHMAERLPEFDGDALEAKYARRAGRAFNDVPRDAFAELERMAMRFALADRVVS